MNYYICYNGKFIAMRKSIGAALNLIKRKGFKDDRHNQLYLIDGNGDTYNPSTGAVIE